jgi:hypothetical protein
MNTRPLLVLLTLLSAGTAFPQGKRQESEPPLIETAEPEETAVQSPGTQSPEAAIIEPLQEPEPPQLIPRSVEEELTFAPELPLADRAGWDVTTWYRDRLIPKDILYASAERRGTSRSAALMLAEKAAADALVGQLSIWLSSNLPTPDDSWSGRSNPALRLNAAKLPSYQVIESRYDAKTGMAFVLLRLDLRQ